MYGGRICLVLLTVQNTYRRPLLFIENRHFIGLLHKENQAASTEINLLSLIHVLGLDETWSVAYNLGETQTCNLIYIFFFSVARSSKARGKRRKTFKSWRGIYPSISSFFCVMEKLLFFYICEIYSGEMWSSCKRSSGTQIA